MSFWKTAALVSALTISVPAFALSPAPTSTSSTPATPAASSSPATPSSSGGAVDVPAPSMLLLLGAAVAGLALGRRSGR